MPNGVDIEAFSPGRRRRAGFATGSGSPTTRLSRPSSATLDRAHHFKRLDLAIEALARPGGEGAISSSPAAASCWRGSAAGRGAPGSAERVHFLGAVPHAELPAVLRAADFLLLTTEPPESFGIVLIEAMACGLPVVATDYPGVAAVIDDGETGWVVPGGDAGAVAAALGRMDGGRAEGRRRLGSAGAGPRPSASGPGRRCSTAWTAPTKRPSPPGARGLREPAARRLLLPAVPRHRRGAAGDDGQVPGATRATG